MEKLFSLTFGAIKKYILTDCLSKLKIRSCNHITAECRQRNYDTLIGGQEGNVQIATWVPS